MKGFQYLMKIGHLLNVLALNSEIIIEKVLDLGIRGFIKYLKKVCSGAVLDSYKIKDVRNTNSNWKLYIAA